MKNRRFFLIGVLFLGISAGVYFIKAIVFLDPDFGWHLRLGQLYFRNKQVFASDPFSYTMSSFPFIDHEWLTNLLTARIYSLFGNIGLAIIYSAAALSAVAISLKTTFSSMSLNFKLSIKIISVPAILSVSLLLPFFGVRPQVESWLFLSLLLFLLMNEKSWVKYRLITLFFVVLWTNLHGSFPLGLFTLGLVLGSRMIRKKKVNYPDLILLIILILCSGINPYGFGIWHEIWQQMSDTSLRWTIQEWRPTLFFTNLSFIITLPLYVSFFIRYRKKCLLEEKTLFVFFLFQALSSTRHLPLWLIVANPIAVKGIYFLIQETSKIKDGARRFLIAGRIVLTIALMTLIVEIYSSTKSALKISENRYYPKEAVVYLSDNFPNKNIFSEYGWGGYLIWKLPDKKVFIDGRMPSWRWSANIEGESDYAMKDYQGLLQGDLAPEEIFNKYRVDTVLWPKRLLHRKTENIPVFLRGIGKLLGFEKENIDLIGKLEESGWIKTYEDDVAVVYKKAIGL